MQRFTRRRTATFAAVCSLALFATACRGSDIQTDAEGSDAPIEVTSILDVTGPLNAFGLPMNNATKLAIEDINANGGLLGRQVQLNELDAQSDNAKYSVLAREATKSDSVVVQGGITSASREVIRPIFHQAELPYFYNILYEGGVCDKNIFATGETPDQQLEPLLKWAVAQGYKKWHILAANYNYGQISADWVETYSNELGSEIVGGPSFFDLTVTDFASELPKIQNSGADLIVSLLVGGAHQSFYKQWESRGMGSSTTIVSPTFGSAAENMAIGKSAAGVYSAFSYFPSEEPDEDDALASAWQAAGYEEDITPAAVSTWNGWHLWAAAVEKAGTTDRDQLIEALESGVEYQGPGGTVKIDPATHHTIMPVKLWEGTANGYFEQVEVLSEASQPTFVQSKCDLIENPSTNQQFTP
jgi:urea transport system substrate-binding protein